MEAWKAILCPAETALHKEDPGLGLVCLNSEAGQNICSPGYSVAGKMQNIHCTSTEAKLRVYVNQYKQKLTETCYLTYIN